MRGIEVARIAELRAAADPGQSRDFKLWYSARARL